MPDLPMKIETIVVSRDGPDRLSGLICQQFSGFEVYPLPPAELGLTPRQVYDDRQWPRDAGGEPLHHRPIVDEAALRAGDRVVWKGNPFDHVYDEGIVGDYGREGGLWVETPTGTVGGVLGFGRDSRACWVCGVAMDLACLARIDFA